VLRILCFLPLALGLSNVMGVQTMVNLKMDKAYTRIILLGTVFGVALNLWLAKEYSYIGGAWALFLTEVFIALLMWFYLQRKKIQVLNLAYFRPAYISETVRPMIDALKQKMGKKGSAENQTT
jgi:PST family polysaccharide transporter